MNRRTFLKSVGAGVALSLASPIGFTSEKFSPVDEELIKKLVTYQPLDGPLGKVFFLQTEKVPSTFGGTGREMSNMVMHVRSQMVDKDATTPTNLFDLLIDDAERIVRTEMDSKFELLKAANDIGRETKRGVGNVIVVDKKNTHLDGIDLSPMFDMVRVDEPRLRDQALIMYRGNSAFDSGRIIYIGDQKYAVATEAPNQIRIMRTG